VEFVDVDGKSFLKADGGSLEVLFGVGIEVWKVEEQLMSARMGWRVLEVD
jgi:hypothetical protein